MTKEIKNIDVIIVGSGPAGLAAAIYAARANLSVLVLEDKYIGGQVKITHVIENYPGFTSISGDELATKMQEQAEHAGAIIEEFDIIQKMDLSDNEKIVETEDFIYNAKVVILGTGAGPMLLPIENEAKYSGKGIHYCAVCDGAMYKDGIIAIVGGGNSAQKEALYFSTLASKVYVIRRKDFFHGEKSVIEKVENNEKIEVLYNWDLIDVTGENLVDGAIIKNVVTGEVKNLKVDAIFSSIGRTPRTEFVTGQVNMDKQGYIEVDSRKRTNISGVYAIGDVTPTHFRQITTAVADGTIAALDAAEYIEESK
ncbi:NAD(P)/FAD-dependent oxidoreductase [uncultured Clostridium sp.]|uniref:NAD(P)/FAD-dependent oxidoreductase n=1 Tax=uncultured Clostridium sp. TaxID=59620 RepID=UPI0026364B49|nr:FAD-dependent oxidoreductase [uncultured Clostridium sp.]